MTERATGLYKNLALTFPSGSSLEDLRRSELTWSDLQKYSRLNRNESISSSSSPGRLLLSILVMPFYRDRYCKVDCGIAESCW